MTNLKTATALCLSAVAFAVMAVAAPPTPVTAVVEDTQEALTLTGARHIVADRLAAMGARSLRPGKAKFLDDGNVLVEILTSGDLPVRSVIVDAKSRQVTDARTGAPLATQG